MAWNMETDERPGRATPVLWERGVYDGMPGYRKTLPDGTQLTIECDSMPSRIEEGGRPYLPVASAFRRVSGSGMLVLGRTSGSALLSGSEATQGREMADTVNGMYDQMSAELDNFRGTDLTRQEAINPLRWPTGFWRCYRDGRQRKANARRIGEDLYRYMWGAIYEIEASVAKRQAEPEAARTSGQPPAQIAVA